MDQSIRPFHREAFGKYQTGVEYIERLRAGDRLRLLAHFLSLPPKRFAERFGMSAREHTVRAYVDQLDFDRDIVVALTYGCATLAGTVQVSVPGVDGDCGELMFTTLDETAGVVRDRLFEAAIATARASGIALLVVNGVGFDRDTRNVLARLGFELMVHESGIVGELALNDAKRPICRQ
jgi:hypothetical protein